MQYQGICGFVGGVTVSLLMVYEVMSDSFWGAIVADQ